MGSKKSEKAFLIINDNVSKYNFLAMRTPLCSIVYTFTLCSYTGTYFFSTFYYPHNGSTLTFWQRAQNIWTHKLQRRADVRISSPAERQRTKAELIMSESHEHLTKAHVKQQTTRKNQFPFFNNFFTDKKKKIFISI